jgi:hypothetical protein
MTVTATCLVQLNQPTGVEMNAYLVLDEKTHQARY